MRPVEMCAGTIRTCDLCLHRARTGRVGDETDGPAWLYKLRGVRVELGADLPSTIDFCPVWTYLDALLPWLATLWSNERPVGDKTLSKPA